MKKALFGCSDDESSKAQNTDLVSEPLLFVAGAASRKAHSRRTFIKGRLIKGLTKKGLKKGA